jgi:hypothetical protein
VAACEHPHDCTNANSQSSLIYARKTSNEDGFLSQGVGPLIGGRAGAGEPTATEVREIVQKEPKLITNPILQKNGAL